MTWLACPACDVRWQRLRDCWSCGNPGVTSPGPTITSQHGSPLTDAPRVGGAGARLPRP